MIIRIAAVKSGWFSRDIMPRFSNVSKVALDNQLGRVLCP